CVCVCVCVCRKAHVKVERDSSKAWIDKWGFLTDRESVKLKEPELPPHLKIRPPTPPEKYIQVSPSPVVPQTTQGLIGWRSSQPHLQLPTYGMVHHGRRSFLRELGWTLDALH
uniref:Ciliary microtubule inner protein 1 n=1 Tax=Myripristis murdjan TaxID=586833 RepID=A0A667XNB6_9TELE